MSDRTTSDLTVDADEWRRLPGADRFDYGRGLVPTPFDPDATDFPEGPRIEALSQLDAGGDVDGHDFQVWAIADHGAESVVGYTFQVVDEPGEPARVIPSGFRTAEWYVSDREVGLAAYIEAFVEMLGYDVPRMVSHDWGVKESAYDFSGAPDLLGTDSAYAYHEDAVVPDDEERR